MSTRTPSPSSSSSPPVVVPSPSHVRTTDDVPLHKKIVYSGLSGAIATTIIYPIDITKTKLMNDHGVAGSRLYKGPIDCFKQIVTKEGFKGLYRGWPPNVLFVMPEKAIKLTMNDVFRAKFRAMRAKGDLPLALEMAAGGLAGFCQVIVTNPMELLKIQGATMTEKIKSGEMKEKIGYVQLCRQLGVSGLYTGVISTLLRDVPFSMVYFSTYAQSKAWLIGDSHDINAPGLGLKAFLAGAIAGTSAAALTCPIDVIKTRVHAAAKPIRLPFSEYVSREFTLVGENFSRILQNEGPKAFFKGIIPRCLIISPLFAITMACYEKFQQVF